MPRGCRVSDIYGFYRYLDRWGLERDGDMIVTHSSRLLPVRRRTVPMILKLAVADEEKLGCRVLAEWPGGPVVPVLERADHAILMPRADASPCLTEMAEAGSDDAAVSVLCDVLSGLHGHEAPASVQRLEERFTDLFDAPGDAGPVDAAKAAARSLLDTPEAPMLLHGDMHHGNVLHFGKAGWRAIDPKGVCGERGFDYANIFCNPTPEIALAPGRFEARLARISEAAGIAPERLAAWVVAWTGLSSVWSVQSGDDPGPALEVGARASSFL